MTPKLANDESLEQKNAQEKRERDVKAWRAVPPALRNDDRLHQKNARDLGTAPIVTVSSCWDLSVGIWVAGSISWCTDAGGKDSVEWKIGVGVVRGGSFGYQKKVTVTDPYAPKSPVSGYSQANFDLSKYAGVAIESTGTGLRDHASNGTGSIGIGYGFNIFSMGLGGAIPIG